jgi:indole-3-glycerol phosphate synthase
MNILEKIAAVKREEVRSRKVANPLKNLERSVYFKASMPSFYEALTKPVPSVIGEFKRRSPSRGEINLSAGIRQVALGYQNAGIAAMSVLTDEQFFGGNNSDLQEAAALLKIPLLRKDFIVDEYQVVESKSIGAGAILLIASILTKKEVDLLSGMAVGMGMDVLFEIHDPADIEKMNQNIRIVGVNNRNLRNFKISINNSADLFQHLPQRCLKVAESGFQTSEDVFRLYQTGYDAFLIGENFMKSEDPGKSAEQFIEDLKHYIAE